MRHRFDSWFGKIPWSRKWQPTPVLLPGKSHGWRSLVGYRPWSRKESDMTEWLHFHFSLSTKKEQDLYTQNYTTSWKEIKCLNKWEDISCLWIGRPDIVKMTKLPKIDSMQALSKSRWCFFCTNGKTLPKSKWKCNESQRVKTILKKKRKSEDSHFLISVIETL